MTEFADYYEILQVHPKAEPEVIEKAYRALIAKYHPDHGGDGDHARLIIEAYETLKDPVKRANYNIDWAAHSSSGGPASAATAERLPGWATTSAIVSAFRDCDSAYRAWVAASGGESVVPAASGDRYWFFVDKFAGLIASATSAGMDLDEAIEAARYEFPLAAESEGVWRIRLIIELGDLKDPGLVVFPASIDRAYATTVERARTKKGNWVKSYEDWVWMLSRYFMHVARFFPELKTDYLRLMAQEYPFDRTAAPSPPIERLAQVFQGDYSEEAWADYAKWSNHYFNVTVPAQAASQAGAGCVSGVLAAGCAGVALSLLGIVAVIMIFSALASGTAGGAALVVIGLIVGIPIAIAGVIRLIQVAAQRSK